MLNDSRQRIRFKLMGTEREPSLEEILTEEVECTEIINKILNEVGKTGTGNTS